MAEVRGNYETRPVFCGRRAVVRAVVVLPCATAAAAALRVRFGKRTLAARAVPGSHTVDGGYKYI